MTEWAARRKAAGWSQVKAAGEAKTTIHSVRMFETGGPDAIKNEALQQRLSATYAQLPAPKVP